MTLLPAPSSGRGRRLIGATAVGAVAAVVSLAGAPGAYAANDFLEFSLDGRTFSASVSGPIFRDELTYVPGGTADATLWIRNTSDEPARLSSAAVMVRSDPQLNRQLGLSAGPASDPAVRASLGGQGSCTDISRAWDLGPGEKLELSLVVDLSPEAGNETMNRTADFDVLFLLESREAAPRLACEALTAGFEPPPDGSGGNPGSGSIGTESPPPALVALPGTGRASAAAAPAVRPAGLSGGVPVNAPAARLPKGTAPLEQPAAILPAAVFSTVEPILRSLPGTLLITMSVIFTAVVVLRVRNRDA